MATSREDEDYEQVQKLLTEAHASVDANLPEAYRKAEDAAVRAQDPDLRDKSEELCRKLLEKFTTLLGENRLHAVLGLETWAAWKTTNDKRRRLLKLFHYDKGFPITVVQSINGAYARLKRGPSAPQKLRLVEAGESWISIEWDVDKDHPRHAQIKGFELEYKLKSDLEAPYRMIAFSMPPKFTVRDLLPDSEYVFRVRCRCKPEVKISTKKYSKEATFKTKPVEEEEA